MQRIEAIKALADVRKGALSVAIMQSCAAWHDAEQADEFHVDAQACMGSACAIGLGLALAQPSRKVIVLDGDGGLLMQLGSLITVVAAAPANFYHFVFDNGAHQSSGNQPVPAVGEFDWCQLALSAGYRYADGFSEVDELRSALPHLLASRGPVLVRLGIDREDGPARWPKAKMADQIQAMKAALAR
ncbi:MAG TPA: thiamine pyrophosphate-dependent enzyme [Chloroflexota bacterium]|nr:thiamine pyrophosphate-dependent enzyme [Chloroflexota bacterium]